MTTKVYVVVVSYPHEGLEIVDVYANEGDAGARAELEQPKNRFASVLVMEHDLIESEEDLIWVGKHEGRPMPPPLPPRTRP